jgi:hypothetical protein
MDACDSIYGGVGPGVHALPEKHRLATMPKTARIRQLLSVDVPLEEALFVKTELEVLRTPSYQIQKTQMPNHPGQVKISVYDRSSEELVEFQMLADSVPDGRFYCNSSDGDMMPQKAEQEAAKNGVNPDWHFEFLDLVDEDGVMYRHFRMMLAESFLALMGAKDPSERPTDAYYEYWDNAETLVPYRLLDQEGTIFIFESMSEGADDSAAEALFESMGKGSAWDDVMTCLDTEQDVGEPMVYTNGFVLPQMVSPMSDLDAGALQFYVTMIDSLETEWVENTTASNAGWDQLAAVVGARGPLADFAKYALKSNHPLAMPDVCEAFCPDVVKAVGTVAKATEDICATPDLTLLSACIFEEAAPRFHVCGKSPAAMVIQECSALASSGTRRLSGGDEFDEEGDFEEEEEDKMKVTTISSGLLKQAADPGPPMPTVMKLADGSNSLDLQDLDDDVHLQIARALNMESPPKTGRILFNSTKPGPGGEVKNVEGLVDLPGVDSPAASRRLWLDMKCLAPNVGPGCVISLWVPQRNQRTCDPLCDEEAGCPKSQQCRMNFAIKVQLFGPAAGAMTIAASGCPATWPAGPFTISLCASGGLTVGWFKSCGNKFPFTIDGYVQLELSLALDLGIFSFTLAAIGIRGGAGISNYETHCWQDRRRRRWWGGGTRRCNYACDLRVYVKGWLSILFFKLWAQIEYWTSHKDFDLKVGLDMCLPWPFSCCWTVIEVKVF